MVSLYPMATILLVVYLRSLVSGGALPRKRRDVIWSRRFP